MVEISVRGGMILSPVNNLKMVSQGRGQRQAISGRPKDPVAVEQL